jgi:predicted metal-dependent hydrolase
VSRKSKRVAEMVADHHGQELDPHYLGYFQCFNQQLFYEAHEVLEHLWLKDKHGPNGAFYKGLIQLAGAFVHVQKGRSQPAGSLLKLTLANLEKYPQVHEHLSVETTCKLARKWLALLEQGRCGAHPMTGPHWPVLKLEQD